MSTTLCPFWATHFGHIAYWLLL